MAILEVYADELRHPVEIGNHLVDGLIRLGLIGTIIGFILMLQTLVDGPLPQAESIQKLVANHYKLRVTELKSRNNSHQVAFPRQIAMYLCKRLTPASLQEKCSGVANGAPPSSYTRKNAMSRA